MIKYLVFLVATVIVGALYLQPDTDIDFLRQLQLLLGAEANPDSFSEVLFVDARLPRLTMALLVGLTMGLTGSLIQQLTRNPLLSPLTMGVSSGAWLALVILNVWFPFLISDFGSIIAMAGAVLAMVLVLAIAGLKNLDGLPVVLAGMAVNVLFGAVATAIILLHDQYSKALFIWGAGDLAQNGWQWVSWLLSNLLILIPILLLAPGFLGLLRLGQSAARGRGANVALMFITLTVFALWAISASITAVGVIGFVGLLAPNLARFCGARTPKDELIFSACLGILLLIASDGIALFLSQYSNNMVVTGITTALVGAPALLWVVSRKIKAQDQLSFKLPAGLNLQSKVSIAITLTIFLLSLACAFFLNQTDAGFTINWPSEFVFDLRWPRVITAVFAGMGMAASGVILQRIIHNPLATPDLLGMSAGAVFSLVLASVVFNVNINQLGPFIAILGSAVVLGILLLLGRRNQFSPAFVILTGLALSALMETLVQLSLMRATEESYVILFWLAGSTYRVEPLEAISLAFVVTLVLSAVIVCHRWLTLLSCGRSTAAARGLNVNRSFVILLCASALLCAVVTAMMGPIAFVGLVAPHMAAMLGAKSAMKQLLMGSMLGATLMLMADQIGQHIIFPLSLAAGTVVAVIGGLYFVFLLIRSRAR